MERRTVLAGVAGVAGFGTLGAYRLGAFDDPPFTLKVYNAEGDETDVTCDLPDDFLDDSPVLADLVDEARGNPVDEPATQQISRDRAANILSGLEANCEDVGGLYVIQGDRFFISMAGEEAHGHGEGDSHDHEH